MVSTKLVVCFFIICVALTSAGRPCRCRKVCKPDERPTSPCKSSGTTLCCPKKLGIGVLTSAWGYDYRHRYPYVTRSYYPRISTLGGGGGIGIGLGIGGGRGIGGGLGGIGSGGSGKGYYQY